jgi:hypothetical protein
MVLGVTWGMVVLVMVVSLPGVELGFLLVSLVFPVYYAVLSLILHSRRPTG